MNERVVLVAGTRPEFIKLHPIALALAAKHVPSLLITTEQHHSADMRDRFFEELDWPCPVQSLSIDTRDPLGLIARICEQLPQKLVAGDVVLAEGDTTSVLAASLVANKLRLRLAHVEAGLRSYDLRMPEEHNRRVCDHLADYLFAPSEFDARHLKDEHCPGVVVVTGNTVLDAVRQNMRRAEQSHASGYLLLTLHRQENVDDPAFLEQVIGFLTQIEMPCIFPVHPRTRDRLVSVGLWDVLSRLPNVETTAPMGYLAFLGALRDARVIVTDSGGVQEEATAPEVRRPTVVLRTSTERVPSIDAHFAVLAPANASTLCHRVQDLSWFQPTESSPFGDGYAAEAIVAALGDAALPAR